MLSPHDIEIFHVYVMIMKENCKEGFIMKLPMTKIYCLKPYKSICCFCISCLQVLKSFVCRKKKKKKNMTIIDLWACLTNEDKKKQFVMSQGQLDSLVLA